MNDSLIIYKTDWMNEYQFDHFHMKLGVDR